MVAPLPGLRSACAMLRVWFRGPRDYGVWVFEV